MEGDKQGPFRKGNSIIGDMEVSICIVQVQAGSPANQIQIIAQVMNKQDLNAS